jgi:arylsulfatase A-like enzyme
VLGNLQRIYGEELTTIVVSDHGMGKKSYARGEKEITGDHTMYGILIMSGDGIQENVWLEACSVLDIAPTILHLMGLPIGQDMEGHVIREALTPRFLKRHPIKYIPTYEDLIIKREEGMEAPQLDRDLDKEIMERLRSLGYIK